MIMTDAALLADVEAFLARTGMAPTRLGLDAMADGALVKGLREGRSLSLKNAEKLVTFMATYRPAEQAAA